MAYYVYQYLHPEYGHLYCGRTDNLYKRIYDHNNKKEDNIPRKYEKLLKESVVMYVELLNKAEGISVEAYCINKYKPYLNKALIYEGKETKIKMEIPKWEIFNPKKAKQNQRLYNITKEEEEIQKEISNIENDIKIKKDIFNKLEYKLHKIN